MLAFERGTLRFESDGAPVQEFWVRDPLLFLPAYRAAIMARDQSFLDTGLLPLLNLPLRLVQQIAYDLWIARPNPLMVLAIDVGAFPLLKVRYELSASLDLMPFSPEQRMLIKTMRPWLFVPVVLHNEHCVSALHVVTQQGKTPALYHFPQ